MPPFMKVKTAGLPRWAWALMLTGAIGAGLYFRSRSNVREVETEQGESLEALEGTPAATGLATAGLVGPAQGQVVPVEAPYIPEGLTDAIASLTDLTASMGAYLGKAIESNNETKVETITGGGAPTEPVNHTPPVPATPSCPAKTAQAIQGNKNEIARLQGEIDTLQGQVAALTSKIQAHPKAKDADAWKQERTSRQTNIDGKRAKVTALSGVNQALRAVPGCAKI